MTANELTGNGMTADKLTGNGMTGNGMAGNDAVGTGERGSVAGRVEVSGSAARRSVPGPRPATDPTVARLRVLVIDNYDSFTYNLVQYVAELGADVTIWRNDAFGLDEVAAFDPDAIIISPGPCTPAEAGASVDVVRRFGPSIPILGVCLGHQAIGVAYGARVVRARHLMHGKVSAVRHDGSGPFAGLPNALTATRYHSLVVEDLPDDLVATAWTDEEGGSVLMAMRHRSHPVWGVQFHPESILTEHGHDMLLAFLRLARDARVARG